MELNWSSSSQEIALIDLLKKMLAMGRKFIANGSAKRGQLKMWMLRVRHFLLKIYGTNHELNRLMDPKTIPEKVDVIKFLGERLKPLKKAKIIANILNVKKFKSKRLAAPITNPAICLSQY